MARNGMRITDLEKDTFGEKLFMLNLGTKSAEIFMGKVSLGEWNSSVKQWEWSEFT